MKSRASVARHPIHPILVMVPVGLWLFSFVCDIGALVSGGTSWDTVASYTMAGGIVGAVAAVLPGFLDLFTLPRSRARRLGIWHMALNLAVVFLYSVNLLWRHHETMAALGPFMLSVLAVLMLAGSGWLGGEMVYVHGVAVDASDRKP